MHEVLFICTGNYYRSRYAEALFNHEAKRRGLKWRAFSRGLAIHLAPADRLSPHTMRQLREKGIDREHTGAEPVQAHDRDFHRAKRVIALKELEHRPMMAQLHPDWERRIEYWAVDDIDFADPKDALAAIETHVMALLEQVAADVGK